MACDIASYLIIAALAVAGLAPRPASADDVSFVFGGATSFSDMATGSLVANYRAAAVGPYQAVGSALGIDRFKSGAYGFGVSDDAMSVADEQSLPGGASFKLTIPLVISTYSFFVGSGLARGSVKLDALQSFNIYRRGAGQQWTTYTKALRGAIVRVARADGSGTSLVVKKYWLDTLSNARVAAAAAFPGNPDESPFPFPGLVLKTGGSAVCSYAAATRGSIVYSQMGTCLKFNTPRLTKLSEVALKNAASPAVYVTASGFQTNVAQILPRPQPPATASWASVGTIFQRGAATPPIASLIFQRGAATPPIARMGDAAGAQGGCGAALPQVVHLQLRRVRQELLLRRAAGHLGQRQPQRADQGHVTHHAVRILWGVVA